MHNKSGFMTGQLLFATSFGLFFSLQVGWLLCLALDSDVGR